MVPFQLSSKVFRNRVPSTQRMNKFFSLRVSATPPVGVGPTLHPVNATLCMEKRVGTPATSTERAAEGEEESVVMQSVNVTQLR